MTEFSSVLGSAQLRKNTHEARSSTDEQVACAERYGRTKILQWRGRGMEIGLTLLLRFKFLDDVKQ
jgi:hypothetical protein